MNLKSPDFLATQHRSLAGIGRLKGLSMPLTLVFCAFTASVFQAPSANAQNANSQSAEEILRAVLVSEAKIQFSATQIVQRGATREVAKLYRSGFKRRLEWSAPGVKAGDILVDDGQNVTLYHRADKTAIQTLSFRRASVPVNGDWKVSAPATENGRLVRVLSRANGRKISVDTKTNAVLRMENARTVTTLQNPQFEPVSEAKFRFAVPSGVTVTRINGRLVNDLATARRLVTWVQPPAQLPSGYVFESAIAGENEIWLRYSNGQKRFSIFQQPTSDAGKLAPQKVSGGYFWRSDGLRFLLTGAPEGTVGLLAKTN